jgi:hypothetical protein
MKELWKHHAGYAKAHETVLAQDLAHDLATLDELFGRDSLSEDATPEDVKREALRQLEIEWRSERDELGEAILRQHIDRRRASTVFWHYTGRKAAEDIIENGFRDGTGPYLTAELHSGVWLSDVPLGPSEGAHAPGGDGVYLRVTLPHQLEDMAGYEWVSDPFPDPDTGELCMPPYREWLVPAEKINGVALIELLEEVDVE